MTKSWDEFKVAGQMHLGDRRADGVRRKLDGISAVRL